MKIQFSTATALAVVLAGLGAPAIGHAQEVAYGSVDDGGSAGGGGDSVGSGSRAERPQYRRHRGQGGGTNMFIAPYIEAEQVVSTELSPGSDTVTYTQIAAGIDATIAGRNNALSASLRYERRFGYGKVHDGDTISGIVRGYASVVPQTLRIDAGAMAERSSLQGTPSGLGSTSTFGGGSGKIYSAYAGPTLSTHAGDVKVDAHYRIGYTKVTNDDVVTAPGAGQADLFDKSVAQDAEVHLGTRPGQGLPIGIGAGAGYYQEDISNLDQRVRDFHARLDVTVPLSPELALVGGVGYEDVKISARDAVRDPVTGAPVIQNGRYVTDKTQPRINAFDSTGLIWDAGVIWRPSRRTQLEAHVGHRYGTTSYFGSFSYAPSDRSSLNIAVYDNVAGFGGQLNKALADMPAEFTAVRDPISGQLNGCVASLQGGNCLAGVLGSLRSATFRARGVMANYSYNFGHTTFGVGVGYDRRKFIAAPGTVLAASNGLIDENYWAVAYLNGQLSRNSRYSVDVYANWFRTGSAFDSNATTYGATLAYYHDLTAHLSARAALGIQGISRPDPFDDGLNASALAGVRYTF